MKKITLWLFALFASWQMNAQVNAYSFSQTSGTYTEITGGTVLGTGTVDDTSYPAIPIGFNFIFGGTSYTDISVNANGMIALGTTISYSYTPLSDGFASNNSIAALGDDLQGNATGELSYLLTGSAPNQVLTVQWKDYRAYNTTGDNYNFQVKLYETTNNIDVVYGAFTKNATAQTNQIGLRGASTAVFNNRSTATDWSATTAGAVNTATCTLTPTVLPTSGLTFSWSPPSCAAPGGLNATSITATSATIGWNAAIPAPSGYEYVVSTSNTTPSGSGTATTNLSEAIASLLPQTTYYVFVRSNCGGPFSSWNSFSFITACAPITTFPSLEPFVTFLPNQCWSQGDGGDLTAGPATFGANGFYTDGFGNVGFTGAFAYNIYLAAANDWVISPEYTIPAVGYELKFDAAAANYAATSAVTNWESDDTVEVLVSNTGTTNWTVLYTYNDSNVPSNTGTLNVIDLDAYSGQTVRFAYRVFEGATDGPADLEFSIDNFEVRLSPTCPDQTGLVIGTVTATTADVSWADLSGDGAIGYEYAITTSATPPASGTAIGLTFYSASSLSPQTVYYLHVRATCAASTFGNWATTTFTTGCAPITTFPSLEPFATFLPNQCWSQGDGGDLTAGPATFGANGFYTDGFGNVGFTGAFAYNIYLAAANDWVISPEYTIPAVGYELKFDAAAANYSATTPVTNWESDDTVEVLVSTTGTTNWTVLYTYNDSNVPSNTGSLNIIDLDAYSGQTVRFAYRVFEGTANGPADLEFSIDNFEVRLSPTCPDQTGIVIGTVTATTADVSWADLSGSGAIGYEYAITTSATPPASGTAIGLTFYSASSLSPQTVYYLHVRATCAASTFGNWATATFTTACAPIVTLPWIENFDSVTTPAFPPCWLEQNGDFQTSNSTFDNTPHSGANYLRDAWFATNEFMWTPGFDLVAGTSYDFSSWVQGDGGTGWVVDYFVNTVQNSAAATQLGATYNVPGTGTLSIQPHAQVTRSFVPATTGTYYFAVRVNQPSFSPNYVAFDDFELKLSPACPTPSASASGVTDVLANLSWSAVPSAALGYEYVLDNVATDPAVAGTSTTSLTYAASGLTPLTTYYFHIRSVCSVGTYSTWSTVSFTTLATPPVNDNCATAIVLTPGALPSTNPVATTNVGATNSNPPAPGCASFLGGDVWFSVAVPASGNISIETITGTVTDTGLAVYSGACGTLTLIDCDDDGALNAGSNSLVELTGRTPGEILYVNAWDYGNNNFGTFSVTAYDASLSAASFDKSTFVAYPNPVKDVLNLSYKSEISNVRVVNLLGQEVLNTKTNANEVQVNMSALTAGAYIVNITVEDTVHTIKVIKK